MLTNASIFGNMPAREPNWLWLKPRIRMPGEIPGDSSRDSSGLRLLATDNSESHQIAKHEKGGWAELNFCTVSWTPGLPCT